MMARGMVEEPLSGEECGHRATVPLGGEGWVRRVSERVEADSKETARFLEVRSAMSWSWLPLEGQSSPEVGVCRQRVVVSGAR